MEGFDIVEHIVVEDVETLGLRLFCLDRLLELGFSGFPSLALTRRTVDTVDLAPGCIELRVNSTTVLDVSIDGLISCSFDEDCPPDQICRLDLTCGPAGEENP